MSGLPSGRFPSCLPTAERSTCHVINVPMTSCARPVPCTKSLCQSRRAMPLLRNAQRASRYFLVRAREAKQAFDYDDASDVQGVERAGPRASHATGANSPPPETHEPAAPSTSHCTCLYCARTASCLHGRVPLHQQHHHDLLPVSTAGALANCPLPRNIRRRFLHGVCSVHLGTQGISLAADVAFGIARACTSVPKSQSHHEKTPSSSGYHVAWIGTARA